MKKVQVFKDSRGKLFENERDCILSEAKVQREIILDNWERLTEIINSNPEYYFSFIKQIGDKIIDEKTTKEDLKKQFDDVVDIFNKEMKIKDNDYKRTSGGVVDNEPYLWGNDILDGYDVNR